MKVGVFDSGVGGLSVVKSLIEHQLFKEIIYYGDTARVPYGTKDPNTVIRYSLEALEFFNNFNIDLLIIACNTVSAYALVELRKRAHYPVVGVIEPGVQALQNAIKQHDASILIIGTRATINSQRYQSTLKGLGYTNLHAIPTGLFVPLVEEGIFEGKILEEMMNYYFDSLSTPDAIILGCTHFPLISTALRDHFGGVPRLIHSGDAIVEYLAKVQGVVSTHQKTNLSLYASENVEGLRKIAKAWLN